MSSYYKIKEKNKKTKRPISLIIIEPEHYTKYRSRDANFVATDDTVCFNVSGRIPLGERGTGKISFNLG